MWPFLVRFITGMVVTDESNMGFIIGKLSQSLIGMVVTKKMENGKWKIPNSAKKFQFLIGMVVTKSWGMTEPLVANPVSISHRYGSYEMKNSITKKENIQYQSLIGMVVTGLNLQRQTSEMQQTYQSLIGMVVTQSQICS